MKFDQFVAQLERDIEEMEKLNNPPVPAAVLRDLLGTAKKAGDAPADLLDLYNRQGPKGFMQWQVDRMIQRDGADFWRAVVERRWGDVAKLQKSRP